MSKKEKKKKHIYSILKSFWVKFFLKKLYKMEWMDAKL